MANNTFPGHSAQKKRLYDTTNSKLHDAWRGLTAWDAWGKTFRRTWVQCVTGPLTEVLLGRLALPTNGQWCRECSVDPSVFSEKESVNRGLWFNYRSRILKTTFREMCVFRFLSDRSLIHQVDKNFWKMIGAAGLLPYQCNSNVGWPSSLKRSVSASFRYRYRNCTLHESIYSNPSIILPVNALNAVNGVNGMKIHPIVLRRTRVSAEDCDWTNG